MYQSNDYFFVNNLWITVDYKSIWKKTKEDLKKVLPEHGYEAWIETLSPVGATNNIH